MVAGVSQNTGILVVLVVLNKKVKHPNMLPGQVVTLYKTSKPISHPLYETQSPSWKWLFTEK